MIFLSSIRRHRAPPTEADGFPWTVPLIRDLETLDFTAPVTFLVGENGSGKSTLLEGIAAGMDAIAAGSRDLMRDPTLRAARDFASGYVFSRRRHARTRLFLRAEDVFGYTNRLANEMDELSDIEQEFSQLPEGWGRDKATGMARAQRAALTDRYGTDPDAQSHGETFLALLRTRLVPTGLYFLDEPETPLSPTRVLALIALIAALVADGCQFVIATHSPILLALPGAVILEARDGALAVAEWNDLEHVRVTRAFLNDPASVLRRLLD